MNGSVILTLAAPPISPLRLCLGSGAAEGRRPIPPPAAVCGLEDAPRPPAPGIRWREDREGGSAATFQEELGTCPLRPAQVVRESWGYSAPRSPCRPASQQPRGQGASSVLERGCGPAGTLGPECRSRPSPHRPHSLTAHPLPLHSLRRDSSAPSHSPDPWPASTTGRCLRPFSHLCCCPALPLLGSLPVPPPPPTCLPVRRVLCAASASSSLYSPLSLQPPSLFSQSAPTPGRPADPTPALPLSPSAPAPRPGLGDPASQRGRVGWEEQPGPGAGLTRGLTRLQVTTAAATALMGWSPSAP